MRCFDSERVAAQLGQFIDAERRSHVREHGTASDLFLLMWDDYGWSSDIGGLAILDGTSLLDPEGRVRIEAIRQRLEPRLHRSPASDSCSADPGGGWAGHCGSTPRPSTSPTTSESTNLPLPAAKPS